MKHILFFLTFLLCITSRLFSKEECENKITVRIETITAANHVYLVFFVENCVGANVLHHPDCPCQSTKYLMTPQEKTAQGMVVKLEKIPN